MSSAKPAASCPAVHARAACNSHQQLNQRTGLNTCATKAFSCSNASSFPEEAGSWKWRQVAGRPRGTPLGRWCGGGTQVCPAVGP